MLDALPGGVTPFDIAAGAAPGRGDGDASNVAEAGAPPERMRRRLIRKGTGLAKS